VSEDEFGFDCNTLKRNLASTTLLDSPVVSAYDKGAIVLVQLAINFGVVQSVVVEVHTCRFSGNDVVDGVSCTLTTDELTSGRLVINKTFVE